MSTIGGTRTLAIAQAGFRRDLRSLFAGVSATVGGIVHRYAGADGQIPPRLASAVAAQAGQVVMSAFVGIDGRSPYGQDGVTPLAAYPRLLNTWIVYVSRQAVATQQTWLKQHTPADVYGWLSQAKRPVVREAVDRQPIPVPIYDPAPTWVDPNGYVLSDRVWQNAVRTRQKLDALLSDLIREGMSATRLAHAVEGFLLPGRLGVRTTRPYGRDASYDAMRLGRTEISHAYGQMAYVSTRMNPYCASWDWALSASHPKQDICDRLATLGPGGERLREPYPLSGAPVPPAHPHCICNGRGVVTDDPATVTARLRAMMQQGDPAPISPAAADAFLAILLGALLTVTEIQQRWAT